MKKNNIEVLKENNKTYCKLQCICHEEDHTQYLIAEYDKDFGSCLTFLVRASCHSQSYEFFKNLLWKIRMCLTILFKGKIELTSDFIFQDKKQLDTYIETLKNISKKF